MAKITKTKVVKIEGCKGEADETCEIKKDVVLGQLIFDKCETCYGTFNSRKITTSAPKKVNKRQEALFDRMLQPKIDKVKPVEHLFPYHWYLSEGYPSPGIEMSPYTEFGSFSCGGGSTMGAKMAGFKSLGGVEIDPSVAKVYIKNHNPEYMFIQGVKEFKESVRIDIKGFKKKYPKLFNLDVFTGSPPCSSFSMSGDREKKWGVEKVFREGQALQVLDTLFFDTIELAAMLKPKIVCFENVKGILFGEAKEYVRKIYSDLDEAGYYAKHFVLKASDMGVPQARERVFFIGMRKDIADKYFSESKLELFGGFPSINLTFCEPDISFRKATFEFWDRPRKPLTETAQQWFHKIEPGKSFAEKHTNGSLFNWMRVSATKPAPTLACENRDVYFHPEKEGVLNDEEYLSCGSFPLDYDSGELDAKWFVGMSVPPVMQAQIMHKIRKSWLDVIYAKK